MAQQPTISDKVIAPGDEEPRVCNWTYQKEADLPNGQKLLRCSKCKQTFYIDPESQRRHWPLHKKVCSSLAADDPRIRNPDRPFQYQNFTDCVEEIDALLQKAEQGTLSGRMLLVAFKELRRFCVETDLYATYSVSSVSEMLQYKVMDRLQSMLTLPNRGVVLQKLWAIPGFACYFLNDQVLLSPEMKRRKELGLPPPKPEKYKFEQRMVDPKTRYDRSYQLLSPYCSIIMSLLSLTAIQADESSGSTGYGTNISEHQGALAAAAIRTGMQLFSCPYTRVAFPACNEYPGGWSLRSEFYFMLFQLARPGVNINKNRAIMKWAKPDELAPGLTVKDYCRNLMTDQPFLHALEKQSATRLVLFFHQNGMMNHEEAPWKFVTPRDRLELLDLYHDWEPPSLSMDDPLFPRMFLEIALLGVPTKILLRMHGEMKNMSPPPDDRTIAMVTRNWTTLLGDSMPLALCWVNMVEKAYEQRMQRAGLTPMTFPEELIQLVAEYALPDDTIP